MMRSPGSIEFDTLAELKEDIMNKLKQQEEDRARLPWKMKLWKNHRTTADFLYRKYW